MSVAAMTASKRSRSSPSKRGTRAASKAPAKSKSKGDAKDPPKFPIQTRFMPTSRIGEFLQDAYSKGYELVCPPVYGGVHRSPYEAFMGMKGSPHFLVVIVKKPQALAAS